MDSFQGTVLGLMDEVERRYRAQEKRGDEKRGIKREAEDEEGELRRVYEFAEENFS